MNSSTTVLLCCIAALAGCGRGERRDGNSRDAHDSRFPGAQRHETGDAVEPAPSQVQATAAAQDVTTVDVQSETYPQRAYYYDAGDADHVYFYDAQQPDAFTYRQVFRDGDRPYYLEHENDRLLERRVFFDEKTARAARVERPTSEREPLERAAREHDQRERDDWTKRSAAAAQRSPSTPQRAPAAPQQPQHAAPRGR